MATGLFIPFLIILGLPVLVPITAVEQAPTLKKLSGRPTAPKLLVATLGTLFPKVLNTLVGHLFPKTGLTYYVPRNGLCPAAENTRACVVLTLLVELAVGVAIDFMGVVLTTGAPPVRPSTIRMSKLRVNTERRVVNKTLV